MIWLYEGVEVLSVRKVDNGYHITHDPTKCLLMVNGTVLPATQNETTQSALTKIQFMCFDNPRNTITQVLEPNIPDIPPMQKYTGLPNNDIDHIDMSSQSSVRGLGIDVSVNFYVKMVLQTAQNGGFLHNFCKLSPEKYLSQNGFWIKKDDNYKMLKSLQITYTNVNREGRRPPDRATDRKTKWDAVKVYRETNKLPALLTAVLPTGETIVPHVTMPLQLSVCPAPRTAEALATHEADACPTAESFGLPAQADAAGPRKKKTKVLRFLSAGESSDTPHIPDVSTAGSGH